MDQEMQVGLLSKRKGQWHQVPATPKGFDLSTPAWRKALLCIFFCLLFAIVILGCAVSPSPFVVIALIVALAVAVLAVLRPRFALLLVFIGAGLPSLLLPLPGHTMRVIEPALLLCIGVIIVRRPSQQMRLRLPHLLALLFMAIAIVSFLHVPDISTNVNAYAADKRLFGWVLVLSAFFCGTLLITYVKNTSSLLVAILLGNIPLYLIGLAQAMHIHLPHLLEASGAQDPHLSLGRLWGPFEGAATFGLYLVNLFVVALACWVLGACRRHRIAGVIMTIATALALIGSGTRSAAIAAVAVTIVAFVITRRYKALFTSLALAGAAIVLFFNKIVFLFEHGQTSDSNRLFLWQEAIKLIISSPWIGIGMQQFHVYYAQLIVSKMAQLDPHGVSVHQQFLEWAMESGIAWLIVGVLLLFSIAYTCWKAYSKAQHGQQALLLAAMLAILANVITGFLDVPLDKVEGAVFLFLLAGLALGDAERVRWGAHGQHAAIPIPSSDVPKAMSATGATSDRAIAVSGWRRDDWRIRTGQCFPGSE
jgi:O-antigen ligase